MPEMAPAIVIAGAGECGTRAAFALREEGWDGQVILAGTEPSPPYERPQVAGLADAASCEVVRVRPDGVEIWFGLADGGRLVAAAAAGPDNSVARDIRLAEMLIARRATPDPAALADPGVGLKSVLRSPVAS